MIKEKTPITIAEVVELVGDSEKAEKIKLFAKEFVSIKADKAKELGSKLRELNILKLNEESIVSLVNFLPKDAQDVMKVLEGVSLDQEEIAKILETLRS